MAGVIPIDAIVLRRSTWAKQSAGPTARTAPFFDDRMSERCVARVDFLLDSSPQVGIGRKPEGPMYRVLYLSIRAKAVPISP
jgi:hypothetical protein